MESAKGPRLSRRAFGPRFLAGLRYVQVTGFAASLQVSQGVAPLHLTLREIQLSQARLGGITKLKVVKSIKSRLQL